MECSQCTFVNASFATICTACGGSLGGGVTCQSCTLQNVPGSVACAACGQRLATTKRRCDVCTLENDPSSSSTCEACKAWWCDACGTCNSAESSACVACCHDEGGFEREERGDDLSAASVVFDFNAAKLEKALRRAAKVSPSLLDHIIEDPARFFADALGQPSHAKEDAAKTSLSSSDNIVEPIVFVDDDRASSSRSSSDESSDDEDASERAAVDEMFMKNSVRCEEDGRLCCRVCKARHSTPSMLKAHMLLAHVRRQQQSRRGLRT